MSPKLFSKPAQLKQHRYLYSREAVVLSVYVSLGLYSVAARWRMDSDDYARH